MERLQGHARLPAEFVQRRFVDEHDVGRRDDLAEPPAQFAEVSRSNCLDGDGVVHALSSQHPLVPGLRGCVDREDHERLSEGLAKHIELRPSAQSVYDDSVPVDSRQRSFGPDSESVGFSLGGGHPADRAIGDGKAPTLGFFPNDIAHANDGKAEILRHGEDLLLAASGHARDADDSHGVRGKGGFT